MVRPGNSLAIVIQDTTLARHTGAHKYSISTHDSASFSRESAASAANPRVPACAKRATADRGVIWKVAVVEMGAHVIATGGETGVTAVAAAVAAREAVPRVDRARVQIAHMFGSAVDRRVGKWRRTGARQQPNQTTNTSKRNVTMRYAAQSKQSSKQCNLSEILRAHAFFEGHTPRRPKI